MLSADQILRWHDDATTRWHASEPSMRFPEDAFARLLLDQHQANFDLWHQEDEARDPLAGDQAIAASKRNIDKLNQHRNDLTERLDSMLLATVTQSPSAPLHSETPGLIIDRLSIMALKIFHTQEEIERPAATHEHRERNRERLAVLNEQRNDLAQCLDLLWTDIGTGRRRFKLYRQLKMYNDPSLNPVLYRTSHAKLSGNSDV